MIDTHLWSDSALKDRLFASMPVLVCVVLTGLLVGGVLGIAGPYVSVAAIGALLLVIIVLLRQYALAATVVIAIQLYIDWYLRFSFVAPITALVLVFFFFLFRSPRYPWVEPRTLWLWLLFLVLAAFPALRGIDLLDSAHYYSDVIFSALVMFWLGLIVGRDIASLRSLFRLLTIFGTLIAIHTIIEATTGVFLFKTSLYDVELSSSDFDLYTVGASFTRAISFFQQPDTTSGFFAMMLFLPFGLFSERTAFLEKILYLVAMFLILLALLFTYGTGGWVAAGAGLVTFLVLAGRTRYRIQIPVLGLAAVLVIIIAFPSQVDLLLEHTLARYQLASRVSVWQTGIQVIQALPLTGLGLGRDVYVLRAEPYRVPTQYLPVYHPHNSYLELAALGGIQLSIVFLVLLVPAVWLALRNWMIADLRTRSLLGGGLAFVVTLSCYSLANAGWTIAPLATVGWLVLGAISSPLISKDPKCEVGQKQAVEQKQYVQVVVEEKPELVGERRS